MKLNPDYVIAGVTRQDQLLSELVRAQNLNFIISLQEIQNLTFTGSVGLYPLLKPNIL